MIRSGWKLSAMRRRTTVRRCAIAAELLESRHLMSATVPKLVDDEVIGHQDGPEQVLNVLGNDVFPNGYKGARRITSASYGSAGGFVDISEDGQSLIYAPSPAFAGGEQIVYIVDDAFAARVNVNVVPVVHDDYADVLRGERISIELLANDEFWSEYKGPRRISDVSATSNGGTVKLAANGRSVIYSAPNENIGYDTFEYFVDDLFRAQVNIYVRPGANWDNFEIEADYPNQPLDVTANDEFQPIAPVISVGRTTAGGIVTIIDAGLRVSYSPPPGFTGYDSFPYRIAGGYENTVSVDVVRTPVVQSDRFYVTTDVAELNVLLNDTTNSHYTGPRRITAVEPARWGTVGISEDGRSLIYSVTESSTQRRSDGFKYTVDGVHVAWVSIEIPPSVEIPTSPPSHPPVLPPLPPPAPPPLVYRDIVEPRYDWVSLDQNSPTVVVDVLSNDDFYNSPTAGLARWSYPLRPYEGRQLITRIVTSPSYGKVSISEDGKFLSYQPDADYFGSDTFRYEVDGIATCSVWVNVVRRVRDDLLTVPKNSQDNRLDVRINDPLDNYHGAGHITDVTVPTNGGTLTIAKDGLSLSYTPARGFRGRDQFVYTLDGRHRATVDVIVGSDTLHELVSSFPTREELGEFLIARAIEKYSRYFYRPPVISGGGNGIEELNPGTLLLRESGVMTSDMSYGSYLPSLDYSVTNTQIAGVDEGDIIENDGQFLYILSRGELRIVRAWPAKLIDEVARVRIEGSPLAEYLDGNRLTVISSNGQTIVSVFDITDRSSPTLAKQLRLDGDYFESRVINGKLHILVSNDLRLPRPQFVEVPQPDPLDVEISKLPINTTICNPAYCCGFAPIHSIRALYLGTSDFNVDASQIDVANFRLNADIEQLSLEADRLPEVIERPTNVQTSQSRYETREEFESRLRSNLDAMIDEAFPNFSVRAANGFEAEGLISDVSAINRPNTETQSRLLSAVTLDLHDPQPELVTSQTVFAGSSDKIFASHEHLYVFKSEYSAEDGQRTRILQFAWNQPGAGMQLVGVGEVPGTILNQFSADEYDGHLRIATTHQSSRNGRWLSENNLYVLENSDGLLTMVGAVQGLADGESIRSVRFFGPRAFVVTFRDIDPLFDIDLSDPTQPTVRGQLRVAGYSSYLQVIDQNHALAVGKNSIDGVNGPVQVSLFDVSNPDKPLLIDNDTLPRFSTSAAELDHHAFGWFASHSTLAIPTHSERPQRVDRDGDGFRESIEYQSVDELLVFKIDVSLTQRSEHGILLTGTVEDDSEILRSAYIDNVLYTITSDSVIASKMSAPDQIMSRLEFGGEPTVVEFSDLTVRRIDETDDQPVESNVPKGATEPAEPIEFVTELNPPMDGLMEIDARTADLTQPVVFTKPSVANLEQSLFDPSRTQNLATADQTDNLAPVLNDVVTVHRNDERLIRKDLVRTDSDKNSISSNSEDNDFLVLQLAINAALDSPMIEHSPRKTPK